jgi:hypothetical protein
VLQTVATTISVGGSGGGIAITLDGARAFVAAGLLYVIDTATNTVVNRSRPKPRRSTAVNWRRRRHLSGRSSGLCRRDHLQQLQQRVQCRRKSRLVDRPPKRSSND